VVAKRLVAHLDARLERSGFVIIRKPIGGFAPLHYPDVSLVSRGARGRFVTR
jgi:hypothetical protein